jgi:cytochrome c-type biogenesis protein CcmE
MKIKFVVALGLILAAMTLLIVSAVTSSVQYSYTVKQVLEKQSTLANSQSNLRISGFVIGDSIQYDPKSLKLAFDIVDTHKELAAPQRVLHIVADGHVRPDLLQHEAQATLIGRLGTDGAFYVAASGDSLLLKCPTRYEEAIVTPTP